MNNNQRNVLQPQPFYQHQVYLLSWFIIIVWFFKTILYVKYKDRHLQYHSKRLALLSDYSINFANNLVSECFSVEEWLEVFGCGTKAWKIVVIWSKGPSNTFKNLEILIIEVLKFSILYESFWRRKSKWHGNNMKVQEVQIFKKCFAAKMEAQL